MALTCFKEYSGLALIAGFRVFSEGLFKPVKVFAKTK